MAQSLDIERQHVEQVVRQVVLRKLGAIEKVARQGTTISRSALGAARSGRSSGSSVRTSGTTEMSPCGRNWQARRTSGGAADAVERRLLAGLRRGQQSSNGTSAHRQVESAPRPPHNCGSGRGSCGASSTDQAVAARARVRPGYEIETRRLRLCSSTLRKARAAKVAPMMGNSR